MSGSIDNVPRQVVLLGWPVAHSVSPAMMGAAFAELGMDWTYEARAVDPAGDALAAAVADLSGDVHAGANVTVPHKEAVIPFLHRLGDAAAAIGAVNTIAVEDGRLVGLNTDADGFLDDLGSHGVSPRGLGCLILGAGGSARAVAYALASSGAERIEIAARDAGRALQLALSLGGDESGSLVEPVALDDSLPAAVGRARLVVNCTPVGMEGSTAQLPLPLDALPFSEEHVVYDLVYNPRRTPLVERAAAAGARTLDGLGMLVRQGARALTIWTGREAPVETMHRAALAALAARDDAGKR